jgi:hypothetical protein
VRLIYVDETGISANDRIAVVAGVIIDADQQWTAVAKRIQEIITEFVPENLRTSFCFHAKDLFHGTGRTLFDRRLYPVERAHNALKKLVSIPNEFRLPVIFGFLDKQAPGAHKFAAKVKPRDQLAINTAVAFAMCAVAAEKFMKTDVNDELATMHAEQNSDTEKMIRIARKSLSGKGQIDLLQFLSPEARSYMPITKIIDEISFHKKDDAFLLQIADACALIIRYALEGRQDCREFFDAMFFQNANVEDIRKQTADQATGYFLLTFT